jgi:hypothetical protein
MKPKDCANSVTRGWVGGLGCQSANSAKIRGFSMKIRQVLSAEGSSVLTFRKKADLMIR